LLSCEQFISMIYDNWKLYSQNIHKNNLIVNTILETLSLFDIIFIQEPPLLVIQSIFSSTSCEGEVLVGVSHYPNWTTFFRLLSYCYKLRILELIKRKNLVLGLTQESLIENSLQDCLPFILKAHGPCYILLAYSKQPCIYLKANIHCAHFMTSSF